MTTAQHPMSVPVTSGRAHTQATTTSLAERSVRWVWAGARIAVGWIFLWAFLDKTFGLGYATDKADRWIDGGHPTRGFLLGSADGPLESFYTSIAGDLWADWLFMIGLLAIGLALISGVGVRLAAITGALLLVMMWSVTLPPANNPLIDDHLIMAVLLAGLALVNSGATLGFGQQWAKISLVRRFPILR